MESLKCLSTEKSLSKQWEFYLKINGKHGFQISKRSSSVNLVKCQIQEQRPCVIDVDFASNLKEVQKPKRCNVDNKS